MATTDLEEFIQERLRAYDPNVDLSAGSIAQQQVVQPILRRIGPDPFTMDLEKFIGTRLMQEFPEISTEDGDGIMDLLAKPARVLLEPLVQENKRVRDNLSFRNPDTLTVTESEALGANFFSTRNRGDFSRVVVRLYFTAPQNVVVTPSNYCFTGNGIRFLPVAIQSIATNQMLFNKEGSYYYFDVAAVADAPGEGYNVEVGAITGVYGIGAAVRATNKLKADRGLAEENAEQYIDRMGQELTEKSLVTSRGILAVLRKYFPAIKRAAIVGFNDPEMQRDVLQGSGVGPILAFGNKGIAVSDGTGGPSRRFHVHDAVNFTTLIGPVGAVAPGVTLTITGIALLSGYCADLTVTRVVDATTLEVAGQPLKPWHASVANSYWTLRKNTLTLSGVAGGTELPGVNGEVVVESGKVHIGGMTDMMIRGETTDQGALALSAITDDAPLLTGTLAVSTADGFVLGDFVLGTSYLATGDVYAAFDTAKDKGWVLQVMDGDAGSYRILDVTQPLSGSPTLITDPAPAGWPLTQRWRLLDTIDIDLSAPRETKLSGGDLFTVRGNKLAQIPSVMDLSTYGVSAGDYLELLTGPDAGIFKVAVNPTDNQLVTDRDFTMSTPSVSYRIYRPLTTEALRLPLVRVSSIDILDTGNEPIGSTIPYADPIDVRSFDFTTPTNALMVDIRDAVVGCVGKQVGEPHLVNGRTLVLFSALWPGTGRKNITFSGVATIYDVADQINYYVGEHICGVIDTQRIGISPLRTQYTIAAVPTVYGVPDALSFLFETLGGTDLEFATNHIRSETIRGSGAWTKFTYDANFDAVQVISATDSGFAYAPVVVGQALRVSRDFSPSVNAIVRVGPRALGKARCYFLDPTTFEASSSTRFEALLEDGTKVGFVPDPTMGCLRYPPPPSNARAKDGVTTMRYDLPTPYGRLTSASVDFIKKNILPGDQLVVDFIPIVGDRANAGPSIAGLALKTFVFKVESTERVVVLANDDPGDLTAVTLAGVEKQLNRVLGADVAHFNETGFLEIEPSYEITILGTGTALGYFWMNFSASFPYGASNLSADYAGGTHYTIWHVGQHYVDVLEQTFEESSLRQQFRIFRPGTQRVGTTQMALNKASAGLYYADIQVVSEGSGPLYNVAAHTPMAVTGHKSLGYTLSNAHSHLAFSVLEKPYLHITPSLISVGASDDPENSLQIAGQNIRVNYEWSSLVGSFQSFVSSDSERVTNSNALVRHLLPHYVRFDTVYKGGYTDTEAVQKLGAYISALNPDDVLESVQLQNILLSGGATSVSTPVELVAIVHQEDRRIRLVRSDNYLDTGRLAGFFAESLNVTRKTS